jgi:hypothetical protein
MQRAKLFGALFAYVNNIQITCHETWKCADTMAGEANSMVSVYSTLCRCTATSNFINAVKRQRNLGLSTRVHLLGERHCTKTLFSPQIMLIFQLKYGKQIIFSSEGRPEM